MAGLISAEAAAASPPQLTGAQRAELRARLTHHRANPAERGVAVQELKAKLLSSGKRAGAGDA